jgi:endo-1,4-beta-xylanase
MRELFRIRQNQFNKRGWKKHFMYSTRILFLALTGFLFAYQIVGRNLPENTNKVALFSQFTTYKINVDGIAEPAWDSANSVLIGVPMNIKLSASASECKTFGKVRSLWDGALLYLLIEITDADINVAGKKMTDKDGAEIFFDLWNDKFPKYLEDDGIMRISSEGDLSGSGVYADRLKSYASAYRYNNENVRIGYSVELALNIGGNPMKNGSTIGIDFCINDAVTPDNTVKYRVFWSDGNNRGLDDNSRWGTIILTGYNGKYPKAIDTYMLRSNIKKAESLIRGIWVSEENLEKALSSAKRVLTSYDQTEIDESNTVLCNAMKKLRRKGKYPDPYDLPDVNNLPDPFTFFNKKKVISITDWSARRDEIKELVQYYEYGTMPKAPDSVTASLNDTMFIISVHDKGITATLIALLTVPTTDQCGKNAPYPVVVSIDFWKMKPNAIYLKAGFAVLSIIYSSIASDNYEHKGAFYKLYPYDVINGNDAGTLLAWAWGASRGVDALQFLAKNNTAFTNTFDFKKLIVTGFSRCGKAALLAGLMDERFGVVNPGASGCGGAAVYRYISFGNAAHSKAPYGNVYSWGVSYGCEVLGDKVRHQGHNSNEMLSRFLDPDRIYKTNTNGYGQRLPYDHHEIIAAIAPRAVIITTSNDDYANGAEGDCIGMEGAKPVFQFLNASQNLALNVRTTGEPSPWGWGGGHWLDNNQIQNLVDFSNMVFYGTPLSVEQKTKFYTDPYIPTYNKYYGGLPAMMPWMKPVPQAIQKK